MKLYPKARPVRIKLTVGDEEHSSLESLRKCFNVKEVLEHYNNGGLKNWLRQINRLDLLEGLDRIDETPLTEKCRQCILIFFDRRDSDCTLENILLEWSQTSSTNFKFLLETVKTLPSEEFTISVNHAKELINRAKKENDQDTLNFIGDYFFFRLKTELREFERSYSEFIVDSHKSERVSTIVMKFLTGEENYKKVLKVITEEWDFKTYNFSDTKTILKNLSIHILQSGILQSREKDFKELVNEVEEVFKPKRFKDFLSDSEQTSAKNFIDRVKEFPTLVKEGSFTTNNSEYMSLVSFYNTKPYFSLRFSPNWGEMSMISKSFNGSLSTDRLFEDLLLLFRYTYLCNAVYRNVRVNSYSVRGKLNAFKTCLDTLAGKKGFSHVGFCLCNYLSPELNKHTSVINRPILQCGLFMALMSFDKTVDYSQKQQKERYLKELVNQGYRPALLYAGSVYPSNSLETEFMKLDDVEKMRFVAEHILDF